MSDERFDYPYDPERHGPAYGPRASGHFAAGFVFENRNEFSAWLHERGIDPADALAWAKRMIALHQAAGRGLSDWAGQSPSPAGLE
jgi:hypothetical protein